MTLTYHTISQDHAIKDHVTLWVGAPMVSHHLAKFGGHKYCSSGDMFLLVKE